MSEYTCPECHAELRGENSLRRHLEQSHPQAPLGAARVARMLEGASFPASADELLDYAREHGSEEDVNLVQQFRGGSYRSMTDVARELKAVS